MDQTIKERKSTPTPILMMTKDYPKQMYGNSYCIQPSPTRLDRKVE